MKVRTRVTRVTMSAKRTMVIKLMDTAEAKKKYCKRDNAARLQVGAANLNRRF